MGWRGLSDGTRELRLNGRPSGAIRKQRLGPHQVAKGLGRLTVEQHQRSSRDRRNGVEVAGHFHTDKQVGYRSKPGD